MKNIFYTAIVFFSLAMSPIIAVAQVASGGNFTLEQSVIASGGGQNSTGGTFSLDGTIGQTAAGTPSINSPFSQIGGFWAWLEAALSTDAPTISKFFSPTTISVNASSTVTLTLTNTSASPQTNAAFTDSLTNMSATGGAVTGTCAGTTPNALSAGAVNLSFSGITLPAANSCTVIFAVTSGTPGAHPNTTSGVTTAQTTTAGTPSNTAILTVGEAASYSVAGTVSYGTTPAGNPSKFVSDVLLTAAGTPQVTDTTDSVGAYLLNGLGTGAYSITPSKTAQTDNTGISLQDASEAAKIAFNQNPNATANQRTAADATGNGSVSLQDASEIAKRAFNIASTNIVGQWKFSLVTRSYPNISSNLSGENYNAILVGDVTGNWTPIANRPEAETVETESETEEDPLTAEETAEDEKAELNVRNRQESSLPVENNEEKERQSADALMGGIAVSLPNTNASAGTTILIPVTVGDLTGQNVTAYDLTVSFDPNILTPASPAFDATGTLTGAAGGYSVFTDPGQPAGKVRIGAFGTTPLTGQGTLIFLRFTAAAGAAATSQLNFDNFMFGEGTPQDTTTNGTFMRLGPTAAGISVSGRVMTAHSRGIRNARVTLTDSSGSTRTAMTTTFGYYRFDEVTAGETYVFSVAAKRFNFGEPTQVRTILEDTEEIVFVADEF